MKIRTTKQRYEMEDALSIRTEKCPSRYIKRGSVAFGFRAAIVLIDSDKVWISYRERGAGSGFQVPRATARAFAREILAATGNDAPKKPKEAGIISSREQATTEAKRGETYLIRMAVLESVAVKSDWPMDQWFSLGGRSWIPVKRFKNGDMLATLRP